MVDSLSVLHEGGFRRGSLSLPTGSRDGSRDVSPVPPIDESINKHCKIIEISVRYFSNYIPLK